MTESSTNSIGAKFERLVEIMARLRSPGGCPWDLKQTFDTIKPYTLEETYEVLDAIDRRDFANLSEELGDYLLQAVFYARMAEEEQRFSIADSLDAINAKLIRRHPHVFGDGSAQTPEEVKARWDEIKADEKKGKPESAQGLLDGVPRALPSLVEAAQISSRAAGAGFDWRSTDEVLEKVREELAELAEARSTGSKSEVEDEFGDLLFTLVNVARFLDVDPEQALRKTNRKFRSRFSFVEEELRKAGRTVRESADQFGIEEMESLWQKAKQQHASNSAI
jgi:MazG family protein